MKKVILSLSVMLFTGGIAMAQHSDHDGHNHAAPVAKQVTKTAPAKDGKAVFATATPATTNTGDNMKFNTEEHDFKTIAEGPNADYEFVFTNTGKDPILINNVQASCGCTTPSWPKEPIMPGKTGSIKASYSTAGRPGPFTKTINVLSSVGGKTLTIRGTVEKAPETSVPHNTSMLKTN